MSCMYALKVSHLFKLSNRLHHRYLLYTCDKLFDKCLQSQRLMEVIAGVIKKAEV